MTKRPNSCKHWKGRPGLAWARPSSPCELCVWKGERRAESKRLGVSPGAYIKIEGLTIHIFGGHLGIKLTYLKFKRE